MDLLVIAGCPPYPQQSEAQRLLLHLMRELVQRRVVIDLFCFYEIPEDLIDVPRYEQTLRTLKTFQKAAPDLKKRLQNGLFPSRSEQASSPAMWAALQDQLHHVYYDFIHLIGGIDVYEYYPLVKKYPHLITPLRSEVLALRQQIDQQSNWFKRRQLQQQIIQFEQIEKQIYQPFQTVVMANEVETRAMQNLGAHENLVTVPPGINTDYFLPTGQEPVTPALLWTGDFRQAVNVQAALKLCQEILPAVCRTIPDCRLYLVGQSPPPQLRAQASDQIDVIGTVPDVRPFFELATVYVNPVASYTGSYDGILQALAMMTPIVATTSSYQGLDLQADRDLLQADSVSALTVNIVRLLQSPDLRQRLRSNGRQLAMRVYDWQPITTRYENLYRRKARSSNSQ